MKKLRIAMCLYLAMEMLGGYGGLMDGAFAQGLVVNPTPAPTRSLGVPLPSNAINISTVVSTKIIANQGLAVINIVQINLVPLAADNVALVYGTKTTTECDTGTTAIIGGTTAATGWNLTAGDILNIGNSQGVVWQVPAGKDVCLITSAATQLSGSVTYY